MSSEDDLQPLGWSYVNDRHVATSAISLSAVAVATTTSFYEDDGQECCYYQSLAKKASSPSLFIFHRRQERELARHLWWKARSSSLYSRGIIEKKSTFVVANCQPAWSQSVSGLILANPEMMRSDRISHSSCFIRGSTSRGFSTYIDDWMPISTIKLSDSLWTYRGRGTHRESTLCWRRSNTSYAVYQFRSPISECYNTG